MKAAIAVALFSAAGVLAQSGPLTVNTPTAPVVCEPLQLTWSGGTPPYFLSLVPAGQPNAAALLDFGQQTGNSLTWTVNLTVGTSVNLDLRDNTGTLAQSAPFTIQNGPSQSCLTGGSSGSSAAGGSTASSGSTPAGASTPATTAATTTGANTNTAPGPTNTPATSSPSTKAANSPSGSAPSTSPTNAAISVKTAGGLTTALGAALIALLLA